jgi:hypothetical protein
VLDKLIDNAKKRGINNLSKCLEQRLRKDDIDYKHYEYELDLLDKYILFMQKGSSERTSLITSDEIDDL